jgi:hypothetical protein
MGSGRVLTTTKCMAPKAACLHHCRSPSDRLRARRAGQMGRRWRRGTERPEIDARMKSINDLQTMRIQTRTLQREELGYVQSDEVLILAVSVSVERCTSAQYGQNSRSYAGSHAPRVLRDRQRIGNQRTGPCLLRVPLGGDACPDCGRSAARIEDRRHPIAGSCLTPAKDDMAAAGGEWLGAAGTVHETKVALVDLSYGKRPRLTYPTNRSGKVP